MVPAGEQPVGHHTAQGGDDHDEDEGLHGVGLKVIVVKTLVGG
jgi:hypothetical protein